MTNPIDKLIESYTDQAGQGVIPDPDESDPFAFVFEEAPPPETAETKALRQEMIAKIQQELDRFPLNDDDKEYLCFYYINTTELEEVPVTALFMLLGSLQNLDYTVCEE